MRERNRLLLMVLLCSAGAVGMYCLLRSPRHAIERVADHPDWSKLQAIEQRLASLESREDANRAPAPLVAASLPARVPDRAVETTLVERLAALETRLAALERQSQVSTQARDPLARIRLPPTTAAVESRILDSSLPIADKLRVHEALRNVQGAYTPRMVQELILIGTSNPDATVRADVWRFFDGATKLPVLVPHLLRALVQDPAAEVREEAADTLGMYADDPAVAPALRDAAARDLDQRVRDKAARTLREFERAARNAGR